MTDAQPFALLILLTAAVGLVAVMSNRLTERLKVPSPAIVLAGAAIAVNVIPALHAPPRQAVERVVTVALVCILFDGGMHIGWTRFRSAAGPIAAVGVAGTFLTVAATAVFAHIAFGLAWYLALIVGTAVAPTDPAVVFSVLGQQEISGRSGTILEGESGANDPVGIALMTSLIAAGGLSASAFAHVGGEFLLQMTVGAAIGAAGGWALLWFTRRVPLPSEGLYPLRTLTCALLVFAVATLARGSGFLAVFAAGIALGDGRAPFKREIERFHTALADLAEIVAFVALGLTVDLAVIARTDVWIPGVILGAVLACVIRPALVGLTLIPARLKSNERNFVLFAGLKGAVPILLGIFLLEAHTPDAQRLYGIIAVVVVFSVVVQGSLIPAAARLLAVQMRSVEPQPWALGVRLRDEPSGVHHLTIKAGSAADGRTVGEITDLPGDAWVSFVVRDGQLAPITEDMRLRPGDEVLVLADPGLRGKLTAAFEGHLIRLADRRACRMMDGMHVEAINIGPSDALGPVDSVHAIAGQGLEGDRYFAPSGAGPGEALTMIEAEVLEDVGLSGPQSRRQVVVRGVRVNDLVGKRFRIGEVECVGVELCEPCLHLQGLTRPGIIKDLIHRGGLRADILSGGTISIGDRLLEDHLAERSG